MRSWRWWLRLGLALGWSLAGGPAQTGGPGARPGGDHALLEEARGLRRAGNAGRVLEVLRGLEQRRPRHLCVLLGIAEAAGAAGRQHDRSGSIASFEGFLRELDLAAADRQPKESLEQLAGWMGLFVGGSLARARTAIRGYVERLKRDGGALPFVQVTALWAADDDPDVPALLARLGTLRQAREPRELQSLVPQLRNLLPLHPLVWLVSGEVHASFGSTFRAGDAATAFGRFLALTTAEELTRQRAPERGQVADVLAEHLRTYLRAGALLDLVQVRSLVQERLLDLRKRRNLYLVSSLPDLESLAGTLESKSAKDQRVITRLTADLAWWRKSRRGDAGDAISRIKADLKKRAQSLDDCKQELGLVRAEIQRAKAAVLERRKG